MRHGVLVVCAWVSSMVAFPAQALIVAPRLAGTDYAALRDDMVARIPVYAPGWTEHSDSDPGITLLELFAFTVEDLAYRVSLEAPEELLWPDFDSTDEGTLGSIAYLLLDAAYLERHGTDIREQNWLELEGIDPAWTYAQLRAAATRAVPEPASFTLIAAALALLAALNARPRRASSSVARRLRRSAWH